MLYLLTLYVKKMDTRSTFNGLQELRGLLTTLHDEKREAALLVEHNGLTRINGTIVSIEDGAAAGDAVIKLDSHELILMKEVVAVNGTFSADYTEC